MPFARVALVFLAITTFGVARTTFVDADNDGLDDAQERGPLAALGASPMHADMLVYFCRFADTDAAAARAAIANTTRFYRSLEVPNPDGRRGINLIPVGETGIADVADRQMADDGNWGGLRDKYLPARWRGLAHFHIFNTGGGGQSDSPGTAGSSGLDDWRATPHELAHQFGLSHEGEGFTVQSPLHASLMNYSYNYSFDGNPDAIRLSNGKFASVRMTEQDLEEDLPFDAADLHFLTAEPYYWSVRAAGPGRASVDWNRNGIYGEHHVRADVNYEGDGVNIRPFVDVGPTECAPWVIASPRHVYVVYAQPGAGLRPRPSGGTEPVRLSESRPGRILLRRVSKAGAGPPVEIVPNGIGDPTGAWLNNQLWIVTPVRTGYAITRLGTDGAPDAFPRLSNTFYQDNRDVEPTLASVDGRPMLFFWSRSTHAISYAVLTVPSSGAAPQLGPERVLTGLTSSTNVSVVWMQDSARLALATTRTINAPNRILVEFLRWSTNDGLVHVTREVPGGEDGPNRAYSRPAIAQVERGSIGPSRLDIFYEGFEDGPRHFYTSHQVLDPRIRSGWIESRVGADWDWYKNPPSVAYSIADVNLALCAIIQVDGIVRCSFSALGIDAGPMGDTDELTYIRNVGLKRSFGR